MTGGKEKGEVVRAFPRPAVVRPHVLKNVLQDVLQGDKLRLLLRLTSPVDLLGKPGPLQQAAEAWAVRIKKLSSEVLKERARDLAT